MSYEFLRDLKMGPQDLVHPVLQASGRALAIFMNIEYESLRRATAAYGYRTTKYEMMRASDIQHNSYKHFTLVTWKDDTSRRLRHRGMCEKGLRNRRDTSA